jgi:hypothetical protein
VGEQQSVATPQGARGWVHPPCEHFKIQSFFNLCLLSRKLSKPNLWRRRPRTADRSETSCVGKMLSLSLESNCRNSSCNCQVAPHHTAVSRGRAWTSSSEGGWVRREQKRHEAHAEPASVNAVGERTAEKLRWHHSLTPGRKTQRAFACQGSLAVVRPAWERRAASRGLKAARGTASRMEEASAVRRRAASRRLLQAARLHTARRTAEAGGGKRRGGFAPATR